MTTAHPSSSRRWAAASPMPLLPPVTSARFPLSPRMSTLPPTNRCSATVVGFWPRGRSVADGRSGALEVECPLDRDYFRGSAVLGEHLFAAELEGPGDPGVVELRYVEHAVRR